MFSKLAITAGATACSILWWKRDYLHAAQPIPKYELCQVQVILRHGARTPLYEAPYLPVVTYEQGLMNHLERTQINYKLVSLEEDKLPRSLLDESYLKRGYLNGGCVRGQLTSIGAEQCYQLGRRLRKRYVEELRFLTSNFSSMRRDIYVRSTHVVRTVTSARCVLAGLFDEYGNEPIEIHVTSAEEEVLYPNYNSCAKLKSLTRWAWTDSDKLDGIQEIRKRVCQKLNLPADTQLNLAGMKDNILAAQAHGKSCAPGMDSETAKLVDKGALKILKSSFIGIPEFRDETLKLAIGPFVDILLSNMEKFTQSSQSSKFKFYLYSGHDTTLIPLLTALKIDCDTWPPFASNIVLELYQNNNIESNEERYYVKVRFNDEEKILAGQSSVYCPLSRFMQLSEPVRLPYRDYLSSCEVPESDNVSN